MIDDDGFCMCCSFPTLGNVSIAATRPCSPAACNGNERKDNASSWMPTADVTPYPMLEDDAGTTLLVVSLVVSPIERSPITRW